MGFRDKEVVIRLDCAKELNKGKVKDSCAIFTSLKVWIGWDRLAWYESRLVGMRDEISNTKRVNVDQMKSIYVMKCSRGDLN